MPTYDYVCRACGHRVEVRHSLYDHGPVECPSCHAQALRKAFATPTIVFKGTGWAKKDRGTAASTKAAAKSAGGDGTAPASDGSAKDASKKDGSTKDGSTMDAAGTAGGSSEVTQPVAGRASADAGSKD